MAVRRIVAVTACPTGIAHTIMAAEALRKTAELLGFDFKAETHGAQGVKNELLPDDIAKADLIIVAADIHVDVSRFSGKPVYATSTGRAIRNTKVVIEEAIAESSPENQEPAVVPSPAPADVLPAAVTVGPKNIVGITSCPTGIAHTFMAAEALRKAAKELGHDIKIETQGSVGAKNQLTPEEIARADAVIIAADTYVDLSRFHGKRLYQTTTKHALKEGKSVLDAALSTPLADATARADSVPAAQQAKSGKAAKGAGPYKHLLTGVSYMLPVIVAGGLLIALSFVFGINPPDGSPGAVLLAVGKAAFALIVPVLSGFIAFSIADRPGLAPGFIGGMLAGSLGMGFLGGILSGFLAGYAALFVREKVRLPANFEGLKPVLIIPLLSTLVVGLLLVYVFGRPVKAILDGLTSFLQNMGQANALILGVLLGGMMAVDMGGPVNKAAYTFAVGLLASNIYQPMAAAMAAGMTPPLGMGLATMIAKRYFTEDEQRAGKVAAVLGLSFITEGVIPFAAKDPVRILPACIAGSAVTGGLSMLFDCTLRAPHGGVFVLVIPNAVGHVGFYLFAIAAGTIVTALIAGQLARLRGWRT